MDKKEIGQKLYEWFETDDNICSGSDECCIKECDLCLNCFNKLCKKFGLKYANGEVVEK